MKLRDDREAHLWEKTVHRYVEHGLPTANAIQHADAYIVGRRDRCATDDPSPDRWEVGFRNIVTFVLGPRATFEIAEDDDPRRPLIEATREWLEAGASHD